MCTNCGSLGHRRWECPEASNFTANLVCRICSGIGHVARDCIQKNNPDILAQPAPTEATLDSEYATLMAELGTRTKIENANFGVPWAQVSAQAANPPSAPAAMPNTPWSQPKANAPAPPPPSDD